MDDSAWIDIANFVENPRMCLHAIEDLCDNIFKQSTKTT